MDINHSMPALAHLIHQALVDLIVVEVHVVCQLMLVHDFFKFQAKGYNFGIALKQGAVQRLFVLLVSSSCRLHTTLRGDSLQHA